MSLTAVTSIIHPGNYGIECPVVNDTVPNFNIRFGESNVFSIVIEVKCATNEINIRRVNSNGTVLAVSPSFTLTRVTSFNRFIILIIDNYIQVYVTDGVNWDMINNINCYLASQFNQIEYPTQGDPFTNVGFFVQYQEASEFINFENQTNSFGIASWIQNIGANPTISNPGQVVLCSNSSSGTLPTSTVISLAVLIPIAVLFIILFIVYCVQYEELVERIRSPNRVRANNDFNSF